MNNIICKASDTAQLPNFYSDKARRVFPQTASSFMRVGLFVHREDNKLQENCEKLVKFSKFADNWDGYNAVKFTQNIITKVKNVIENLNYQPNIFPTGRGSIQLEYYKDDDNFLEIEVSNSLSANLFYSVNGKEEEQIIDDNDIVSKLNELYKYYVK